MLWTALSCSGLLLDDLGCSELLWVALGCILGCPVVVLHGLERRPGPSYLHFGLSWGYLGASLGHPGAILGNFGDIWSHLGTILGPSWDHLEPS